MTNALNLLLTILYQMEILTTTIIRDEFRNAKDERLALVNIPKGLVESLNDAGFTIEIILNSRPSDIAQVLGIDDYVANIIYHETKHYYQMII
jgi:hypothetical protein